MGQVQTETITISIAEYEGLLRNSRKMKAIKDTLDEYHLRKQIVTVGLSSENSLHRLRRQTINKIYELARRKDM